MANREAAMCRTWSGVLVASHDDAGQRGTDCGTPERWDDAVFIELLRAADREFQDAAFEAALADALRSIPVLTEQWNAWSEDRG